MMKAWALVGFLEKLFITKSLGRRDFAVDVLRGMAIGSMILVNHHPPTRHIYAPLKHASLLGWTFADVIFPIFLFLVGVSISYSAQTTTYSHSGVVLLRVLRRTAILALISLVLVNFPYYEWEKLKVTGTLMRIAYCYFLASIFSLYFSWRWQVVVVILIILVQWWVLNYLKVPFEGAGVFSAQGNASVYVDHLLLGDFADRLVLNGPVSQGIFPALSSVATTMLGALAGRVWIQGDGQVDRHLTFFGVGLMLLLLGHFFGQFYPVSKVLWTGSYVILMAGLSLLVLALVSWTSRFGVIRRLLQPLAIAGMNALFFYIFAQALQRVMVYTKVFNADGSPTRLRWLIYEKYIKPWENAELASLVYALLFLSICYVVVYYLYRRNIFFKL